MGFLKGLGTVEIIIIIGIVTLIFGGGIAKSVAKRAGQTTKDIKKAKDEFTKASQENEEDKKSSE